MPSSTTFCVGCSEVVCNCTLRNDECGRTSSFCRLGQETLRHHNGMPLDADCHYPSVRRRHSYHDLGFRRVKRQRIYPNYGQRACTKHAGEFDELKIYQTDRPSNVPACPGAPLNTTESILSSCPTTTATDDAEAFFCGPLVEHVGILDVL